jgi:hypothetical protein
MSRHFRASPLMLILTLLLALAPSKEADAEVYFFMAMPDGLSGLTGEFIGTYEREGSALVVRIDRASLANGLCNGEFKDRNLVGLSARLGKLKKNSWMSVARSEMSGQEAFVTGPESIALAPITLEIPLDEVDGDPSQYFLLVALHMKGSDGVVGYTYSFAGRYLFSDRELTYFKNWRERNLWKSQQISPAAQAD